MNSTIRPKEPLCGPRSWSVYLRLPWIGNGMSKQFEKQIKHAVRLAYPRCKVHMCFMSKPMFPSTLKDCLPVQQHSNIIRYQIHLFQCWCSHQYVGKTTQRLETWVKQQAPTALIEKRQLAKTTCAKGLHLKAKTTCLDNFKNDCFSIVGKAHTSSILQALEALHQTHATRDM